MLKAELKYLRKNKFLLAALIVIALIPSIYAVTFLKSMWNPYGKTGELPVAVVNHDRSATMNGKKLTLGADLATNLKHNDNLDFRVVSAKKAKGGHYHRLPNSNLARVSSAPGPSRSTRV